MRTNVKRPPIKTHEGATALRVNAAQQLRRSVMACMLWEDQFYEDGQTIANRIAAEIAACDKSKVADIAIDARSLMKLRHVPLLICRELAKVKALKPQTLAAVIQRPDELAEFVSIYWKDGKCPLASSVKKGLAAAFQKFDAYALGKWNQDGAVKLRDVLFLCHAKPKDDAQAAIWKQLVDGTLPTPDTWEVALSSGANKLETWNRLLAENKLGALALLRNLRNMKEAGVPEAKVSEALGQMKTDRVLPFRFISAARYAPHLEPELEKAMFRCLETHQRLPGKTAIVVDNSGSMEGTKVSAKSEIDRADTACALAMLVREIAEKCVVIGFGSTASVIPARRGFALRDAIRKGPGGGTNTQTALSLAASEGYDRIIVITDEQSHQSISGPVAGTKGYFINVASYQNGIGYGQWVHIDGWSEAVIDYIGEFERENAE